jgi:7,8-dihydropterin-6-yl-methyl-4-(beta-D-ribofuranosyl)aminobenzene 5'-phosphate synthase
LGSSEFFISVNGDWVPDPLLDDSSLVMKTSRGLVIVLGCAHSGIVNILNYAIDRTGEDRIYAVIGGTHLGLTPESQFDPTVRALKEFDIRVLAVSHCTGQGPAARMASEFGGRFAFGHVGFTIEV